jgi:hypothetical protein
MEKDDDLSVWSFGYFKHGQLSHEENTVKSIKCLNFKKSEIAVTQVACGGTK